MHAYKLHGKIVACRNLQGNVYQVARPRKLQSFQWFLTSCSAISWVFFPKLNRFYTVYVPYGKKDIWIVRKHGMRTNNWHGWRRKFQASFKSIWNSPINCGRSVCITSLGHLWLILIAPFSSPPLLSAVLRSSHSLLPLACWRATRIQTQTASTRTSSPQCPQILNAPNAATFRVKRRRLCQPIQY